MKGDGCTEERRDGRADEEAPVPLILGKHVYTKTALLLWRRGLVAGQKAGDACAGRGRQPPARPSHRQAFGAQARFWRTLSIGGCRRNNHNGKGIVRREADGGVQ